tara:strand:- start:1286 stop:2602 length:1317 start_codon:yes stop_codon:yes gene_type:complete
METVEDLAVRVRKLERRVSEQRIVVCGALMLAVCFATLGATSEGLRRTQPLARQEASSAPIVASTVQKQVAPGIPRAQYAAAKVAELQIQEYVITKRLQIVNNKGAVVTDFLSSEDGNALVACYDNTGTAQFLILAGEKGGELYLADEDGLPLIYAGPSEKGHSILQVGGNGDKGGSLVLYNRKGNPIVTAGSSNESHGRFMVNNKEGMGISVTTATEEKGEGYSVLFNRNGKPLFGAMASGESGSIYISNSEEKDLIYAGASTDGQGLLKVKQSDGSDLVYAGADLENNGVVEVSNRQGDELIFVGANTAGNGLIRILNREDQLGIAAVAGENTSFLSIVKNDEDAAIMASDVNGDGLVETYAKNRDRLWSSSFAQQTGPVSQSGLLGDLDGDGDVDGSDVLLMSENYGNKLGKITLQESLSGSADTLNTRDSSKER